MLVEPRFCKKSTEAVELLRPSSPYSYPDCLPKSNGYYLLYQLLLNVLAAHHLRISV